MIKNILNKIQIKICKAYVKLYFKRIARGYKPTIDEEKRCAYCLKHLILNWRKL